MSLLPFFFGFHARLSNYRPYTRFKRDRAETTFERSSCDAAGRLAEVGHATGADRRHPVLVTLAGLNRTVLVLRRLSQPTTEQPVSHTPRTVCEVKTSPCPTRSVGEGPVSYTHLTLPTILRV